MPNRSPRRRSPTWTTRNAARANTTDGQQQQPAHDPTTRDRRYPTRGNRKPRSTRPTHVTRPNPRGAAGTYRYTRVLRPRGTDTRGEAVPNERTDSELLIASRLSQSLQALPSSRRDLLRYFARRARSRDRGRAHGGDVRRGLASRATYRDQGVNGVAWLWASRVTGWDGSSAPAASTRRPDRAGHARARPSPRTTSASRT